MFAVSRYIISLDSRSALREEHVGGKGAGLARLRRQAGRGQEATGFHVPPGFVITPAAFEDFVEHALGPRRAGATPAVQRRVGDKASCCERDLLDLERMRERVIACRIPDHLARPVVRAYRRLGGESCISPSVVAVRSSMVGEDGCTASFAGQLDTILHVQGEQELLEAVKRCWASMFNQRLFTYLAAGSHATSVTYEQLYEQPSPRNHEFHQGLPKMAVVVQRMVDARAAGVAFSADPTTGQRCTIIEAVPGLGDALVRGLVEPDRYVVDARGVLAEARPIHSVATNKPILEEEQVLRLAQIVRGVARRTSSHRAQGPQDIEWAWDGAAFHLLQSRPITSLAGQRVYSNKMVSDMSPGLIKPLVYTTNTLAITRNVFQRIFGQLIGPNDIDFAPLATRIHSRIYTDMTLLGELFERLGLPANLFEMMARDERAERRRFPLTWKMLRTMLRLLRFVWRHARAANEIADFGQKHDHDLAPYRRADWSLADPQTLMAQLDRLVQLHGETQWFVFICAVNMTVRNRLLDRLVRHCAADVVPGDLIRGLVGLKALEPNEALQRMATQVRSLQDELVVEFVVVESDDTAIRAALSVSDSGRALIRDVDAFMARYGFLSINGTDFSETPWIENPTFIWHAIWRAAASPVQPAAMNGAAIREAAQRRARAHLNRAQQRIQRAFLDRLLASTTTYIGLREQISLLMSEDSYQMRRLFLALADHLVACGCLDERSDIFYLTCEEIRSLVMQTSPQQTLRADAKTTHSTTHSTRSLVEARKAEMRADAEIDLPDTICGNRLDRQADAAMHSGDPSYSLLPYGRSADRPYSLLHQAYLVGIGGSSGTAQGHARIVLDPGRAPIALNRDDILIVPFTDVGWTPLFPGIGGIVAETGGQLSHTCIVAREYSLPAVVSVKKATRLIREGQLVTVDGDRGRVYLHEGGES
jgi:pyruvate,water dikinase